MYTLLLEEGLGNQLFEYSFARMLQEHDSEGLKITLAHYDQKIPVYHDLKYSLQALSLPECVEFYDDREGRRRWRLGRIILYCYRFLFYFKKKKYPTLTTQCMMRRGFYFDIGGPWKYVPYVFSERKSKWILGRWQSARYFDSIKDMLVKELRVAAPAKGTCEEWLREIKSCANSVCLHIRMGDYKTNDGIHVCDQAYYTKAVKYMLEHVENPVFFLFSNNSKDIDEIRSNFSFDMRAIIRFIDTDNPTVEDYRLMYSCHHFIISNSSLSWWAQYLGEEPDKIVIAPSRWNNSGYYDKDIYQENWVLIDT